MKLYFVIAILNFPIVISVSFFRCTEEQDTTNCVFYYDTVQNNSNVCFKLTACFNPKKSFQKIIIVKKERGSTWTEIATLSNHHDILPEAWNQLSIVCKLSEENSTYTKTYYLKLNNEGNTFSFNTVDPTVRTTFALLFFGTWEGDRKFTDAIDDTFTNCKGFAPMIKLSNMTILGVVILAVGGICAFLVGKTVLRYRNKRMARIAMEDRQMEYDNAGIDHSEKYEFTYGSMHEHPK